MLTINQVFRGEEHSPYQGARKAEAIVSYMIKQSLPAVTLLTPENFETFVKSDKVVVVGFFEAEDKASNETFTAVANSQRDDFLFGATTDASLAKAEGAKVPDVMLYKSYDDPKEDYEGEFDTAAIQKWTKKMSVPVMGEVNPDTYTGYITSGVPLAYIFVENDEVKKKLGEMLRPVAAKVRGKVNFATLDAVQFGGHAKNLNL
jgi:protein disulfide-isomerase A1